MLPQAGPPTPSLTLFSSLGGADRVGHDGAARAERLGQAHRGVVRGLVLDLGIELGADQDDTEREPHPHHQADRGAERAVGGVVVGEVCQIPGEQRGARKPGERRHERADAQPFPARLAPARAITVEHRQRDQQAKKQRRPAQDRDQPFGQAAEPKLRQHQRKHHDRGERQQHRGDAAERKGKRNQVELDEAAFLALLIDDVEGVDHGLDASIGAPQRQREAEQQSEAELIVALGEQPADLLLDELDTAFRHDAREQKQVGADGRGLGEQAVARHQRGDGRKYREQAEEHHAGGNREQPVLAGALVSPPQDVFPASPRDLPRRRRVPAAADLLRARLLHGHRARRRPNFRRTGCG